VSHTLTIEYGEDVLFSLGMAGEQFSDEARFLLAAKLYEIGRLSSGQAAQLCGKGCVAFLLSLERIGVPVSNLRPEDAEAELAFALQY
jgi:predicted HTH domain antitoxin